MVSFQQASLEDEESTAAAEMPAWPLLDRLPQRLVEEGWSREACRGLINAAQEELKTRFSDLSDWWRKVGRGKPAVA
jgi:hypothetical protein